MLDHIGGPLDAEIAKILLGNYQKKGVAFELGAKVTEITKDGVTYEKDGKTTSVHADKILLSIGRRPVTTGFGLETLGVEVERGAIVTDAKGHTSVAGVWATGDVNGRSMLAHTAYRESEVCINTILGKKDLVRYHTIPAVIYTNPEVATCGYTEEEAKKAGIEVEVATVPFVYSGRYVAENSDIKDGICKLVMDKKYRRLVGVHMIGTYASEMIYGAALMIETQMTVEDLKEVVFPHPTVCEVIREGLFQL